MNEKCVWPQLADYKKRIDDGAKPEDVFPYHFNFRSDEEALEFFNYFYQIVKDEYMKEWLRKKIEEVSEHVSW